MIPFEPGQCACFDDTDGEAASESTSPYYRSYIHHSHMGPTHARYLMRTCCRCRERAESKTKPGPRKRARRVFLRRDGKLFDDDLFTSYVVDNAPHQYRCRQCPAVYSWLRSPTGGIYLCCNWKVEAAPPFKKKEQLTGHHWLRALDPASWNVQHNNQDMHRVTWCEDTRCKTTSNWYKLYSK